MNKYTIGIDVGGTYIKLGLVSPKGKIVARSRLVTKSFGRSKIKLIDALTQTALGLIANHGVSKKSIRGVGIGLPGFLDPKKGVVKYLPNILGWENTPIVKMLSSRLKLPVFIENDANLITLAEWNVGAGKGCRNMICVTLGTGLGGGLILNGALYRGTNYVAGEIGHIAYRDKTIEKYTGNKILHAKAAKLFRRKAMSTQDVFALANKGNKKALKYWRTLGEDVGYVLSGVVNLLNPEVIVLGGGVANNIKYFKPALVSVIHKKSISPACESLKIVRAKLGDDAGILGAHYLVKDPI